MSSQEAPSSDDEPLKVDPLIMIGLGVVFALILVGAAALIMDTPDTTGKEPLTATVTMDETDDSVVIHAVGDFPHEELFIYKNGTQISTMDVSGVSIDETHHVRDIEAGDQIQVVTYINGELAVVNQHEVSDELGSRVN